MLGDSQYCCMEKTMGPRLAKRAKQSTIVLLLLGLVAVSGNCGLTTGEPRISDHPSGMWTLTTSRGGVAVLELFDGRVHYFGRDRVESGGYIAESGTTMILSFTVTSTWFIGFESPKAEFNLSAQWQSDGTYQGVMNVHFPNGESSDLERTFILECGLC